MKTCPRITTAWMPSSPILSALPSPLPRHGGTAEPGEEPEEQSEQLASSETDLQPRPRADHWLGLWFHFLISRIAADVREGINIQTLLSINA